MALSPDWCALAQQWQHMDGPASAPLPPLLEGVASKMQESADKCTTKQHSGILPASALPQGPAAGVSTAE